MILFKDYSTGKKSFTITCVVISFTLVIAAFIAAFLEKVDGQTLWAAIGFHGTYQALYWNKRVRASKDGIEILKVEE